MLSSIKVEKAMANYSLKSHRIEKLNTLLLVSATYSNLQICDARGRGFESTHNHVINVIEEKATGNHSVNLTYTEKPKSLAICSARLYYEYVYASQFF